MLARYDLLAMPTLPMKATPLPPANAPLALWCQRAFEMLPNTSPFDVTGHPAMSIPCGMSAGLPIGLMLVGKHYNETTIYRAAHAFEQLSGYKQLRGRLLEVMKNVEYPEGFFYVERTVVLLFGLVGRLAPKRGLPGLVGPHAAMVFARSLAVQQPAAPA